MARFIAFLLEKGQPTAIAAVMAEKGRWVRWLRTPYFSPHEQGYPVPVTFASRKAAVTHMRYVIKHAKEMGVLVAPMPVFGYVVYEIRHRARRTAAGKPRSKSRRA